MTARQFKRWRLDMGWTQVEAAEHLDITSRTVSNYERGVWPIPVVVALATERLEQKAA